MTDDAVHSAIPFTYRLPQTRWVALTQYEGQKSDSSVQKIPLTKIGQIPPSRKSALKQVTQVKSLKIVDCLKN